MQKILFVLISLFYLTGTVPGQNWPEIVQEIRYPVRSDTANQPALYFNPDLQRERPLLVALHSWSGNYKQLSSIPYARYCIDKQWIFVHPDFRGVCDNPMAVGSEQSINDILDAVDWVCKQTKVDPNRIYLIGVSWGASMALKVMDRESDIWAAASLWCPVWDLETWYHDLEDTAYRYRQDIENSCGAAPGKIDTISNECAKRSPSSIKNKLRHIKIDLNTGINDGHEGPVNVWHSLKVFNFFAPFHNKFSDSEIEQISGSRIIPEKMVFTENDPAYVDKQPLLRIWTENVRFTVFEGDHEIIHNAGLEWLAKQKLDMKRR